MQKKCIQETPIFLYNSNTIIQHKDITIVISFIHHSKLFKNSGTGQRKETKKNHQNTKQIQKKLSDDKGT